MTVQDTILGHLIGWALPRRHDDAAAEGLAFLLQRYPGVRAALLARLRLAEPALPEDLAWTARAAFAGHTDLLGRHGEAARVLVVSKFAGPLADDQPLDALAQLTADAASLLLFVVPEWRRGSLLREVQARLAAAALGHREHGEHTLEILGRPQRVHVLGWTALLNALAADPDPDARANLEQLAGVCRIADDITARPLVREELTDPQVPGRIIQYVKLVNTVVDRGSDAFRTVSGRHPTPWYAIGRRVQFAGDKGPVAALGVDLLRWHKHETGPLWLTFDWNLGQARSVKERLQPWASEHRRVLCDIDDGLMLHLDLLVGRELPAVVDDVHAQLRTIAAQLRPRP